MERLSERIMRYAARRPKGTPIVPKRLLHLGSRAAVDQALSRLARRGALMRAGRGVYVSPVKTRFGLRAPAAEKVVEGVAQQRGEIVARHGAAAANALGLTPQVPTRTIYLTSGPSRKLQLGQQVVELKHAPRWQLAFPGRPAGEMVRALAWLGRSKGSAALPSLELSPSCIEEMASMSPILPSWMAEIVTELADAG
jgi:hypothetical protein